MISVCLASYNGARYIRRQLESILAQLAPGDEVVVSDDGSTDGTLDEIARLGDTRVKVFANPGPHGVNANFGNALSHAAGDYIFLSDQDDVWLEGKVNHCLQCLGHCDLVVHDAIITDSELNPQNKTLFSELNVKRGFIRNLLKNGFTGCCMAFRRELLRYVMPIPADTAYYHDNWIGLMAELKGSVEFTPFAGIYFRRHGGVCSSAADKSRLGLSAKLSYRCSLLYETVKRTIRK